MKLICLFILTLFCVFQVKSNSIIPHQTFIDCEPQEKDISLYNRHVEDTGKFLVVKTRKVIYPEDGKNNTIIHCIKAIDNIAATSNDFGQIQIVEGGIGKNNVIFKITSKRGYGYNYDIEIYGEKIKTD